jgi:hypothetical protein
MLSPGRYVGKEELDIDAQPFREAMSGLTSTLREQRAEAARLDDEIDAALASLGFGE